MQPLFQLDALRENVTNGTIETHFPLLYAVYDIVTYGTLGTLGTCVPLLYTVYEIVTYETYFTEVT